MRRPTRQVPTCLTSVVCLARELEEHHASGDAVAGAGLLVLPDQMGYAEGA